MSYVVHGNPMSTCTRTVICTLEEIGAPYELKVVQLHKGEHKHPDFIAKHQPFGQIPVLYDGDYRIFESRAIARYVAGKEKAEALYPTDFKARGQVEQWLSVHQSNNHPAEAIVREYLFKPMMHGTPGDASKAPELKEHLNKYLATLDNHLKESKFMAGDHFTLADITFLPYFEYLLKCEGFGNSFDGFSHVKAWWDTCSSRPSWKKATAPPAQ